MIIDARTIPDGTRLSADICIIGGGPAGIVLALELSGAGIKVALLESGGLGYDADTQDLYIGPNLGRPYTPLDEARLRFLGGTSNHWTGICMVLNPIDFEARDWMPHSGWPIGYDEVAAYYDRALPYFELQTEAPFDFDWWADRVGGEVLDLDPQIFVNTATEMSPPTLFGYAFEDALRRAPDVTVYLNANVTELDTTDDAATVTGARIECIDGPALTMEAGRYALCAGGVEIPRLLFNSDRVRPEGLGNDTGLVGRFFNDHVGVRPLVQTMVGDDTLERLSLYTDAHWLEAGTFHATIGASEELLRRERLASFLFHLFPEPGRSPGNLALRRLVGGARSGEAPDYLSGEIWNLMTDLDGGTNALAGALIGQDAPLGERNWLGPWLSMECIPNPDSRVERVAETDRFGKRRVGLNWQLTEEDHRLARRASELLVGEFGRLGIGRSWTFADRPDYEIPMTAATGKHHCGTTRMSDDPATGVVDRNCKVHGVSNLYIGSCSVFPTVGHANPTLTIGAMSIRMAEHLRAAAR